MTDAGPDAEPTDDGLGFDPGAPVPTAAVGGGGPGPDAPLAERMRPETLDEVVGQEAATRPGGLLAEAVRSRELTSLVLWGPPGTGKTTIARALARAVGGTFVALSAVTSGVKDVRAVIEEARRRRAGGGRTVLFVDEIHRFNRAQQDAFLPHVEDGTVVLVGATTENPGFSLTRALLSRVRVVVLEPIAPAALSTLLDRALSDPVRGLGGAVALDADARAAVVRAAGGDARRALGVLEAAVRRARGRGAATVTVEDVREGAEQRVATYDRGGDLAYDALSAFHKSLRGSDADAALFWMARMLEGGEDPLVLVRRMVAMACEDVGLADAHALRVALEARDAVAFLGMPEGELALVRAVVYLAAAPKSNAVVRALHRAHEAARAHPDAPVPPALRNAPTSFSASLGHGRAYVDPHGRADAAAGQRYRPDGLEDLRLYEPVEVGDEREVARRVAYWERLRRRARDGEAPPPEPR